MTRFSKHVFLYAGGPDYKLKSELRLTISDVPLETFCKDLLVRNSRLFMICLKLPKNYDFKYLQDFSVRECNCHYSPHGHFDKMSLSTLVRKE